MLINQLCNKYFPLIGRILIAPLFIYAGIGKTLNFTQTAGFMGQAGVPLPTILLTIGILIEIFGSLFLLLGYKTKWAASALIVFTALTIYYFHSNFADQTQLVNAFKNLAIIAGLLMYTVHGAGALSFDNRPHKNTTPISSV